MHLIQCHYSKKSRTRSQARRARPEIEKTQAEGKGLEEKNEGKSSEKSADKAAGKEKNAKKSAREAETKSAPVVDPKANTPMGKMLAEIEESSGEGDIVEGPVITIDKTAVYVDLAPFRHRHHLRQGIHYRPRHHQRM